MNSDEFIQLFKINEKQAWNRLKEVVNGFLGNDRADNYQKLIETMLESFKIMGCRIFHNLHMLHAHLNQFKYNKGAYSEEQRERFTKGSTTRI